MGIHGLRMSCLALFLLLFLLPPLISKAKSLHYHGAGWKLFHLLRKGSGSFPKRQVQEMSQSWSRGQGQGQAAEVCLGIFDLYIILDKSSGVSINWIHIYSFAEDLVKKFQNPKTRISIITFSTKANVIIPLTSDREEIKKGLLTLLEEIPDGFTHMQKGFQKAIEQIKKTNSEGSNVNSVIIALAHEALKHKPFKQTMEEAKKARELGATIFTVGVHKYDKTQMMDIADSPSHSLASKGGFSALQGIVNTLADKTCIEALSVEPSDVCIKGAYQVNISGRGFNNAEDKNQVICRFTLSDSRIIDERPSEINDKSISCPGPMIHHAGEEVSLQVSVNNGLSFVGDKLIITSINCEGSKGIAVGDSSDSSSGSRVSRSSSNKSNTELNRLQQDPEPAPDPDRASTLKDKINTMFKSPGKNFLFKWKFLIFVPTLLVSLLLLCCCWKLCCRKTKKPGSETEKDPEGNLSPPPTSPPAPLVLSSSSPPPANPNTTVILACCGCANRGIQGNLDTHCSCFHPGYHQVPLVWCHPKVQGRCTNIAIMSPSCTHASCSPKLCLPSNRDCLHHTKPSCSSRIFVQPSRDCLGIPQASCNPKICLKAGRECLPIRPTLCSRVCPSGKKFYILGSYPTRCASPSRMLPLLPPHTRQSVESFCQTYPCRPSSK